jgi:hypothetical protein
MTVYQIKINLIGFILERQIIEYNVFEQGESSYTMSREGSIGTYIVQHSALDKKFACGGCGYYFYTKDKNKLKEYGKILDEFMEKFIADKLKLLTKYQAQLETPWGDVKAKESKSKKEKETKSSDDDI